MPGNKSYIVDVCDLDLGPTSFQKQYILFKPNNHLFDTKTLWWLVHKRLNKNEFYINDSRDLNLWPTFQVIIGVLYAFRSISLSVVNSQTIKHYFHLKPWPYDALVQTTGELVSSSPINLSNLKSLWQLVYKILKKRP